MQRQEKEDLNFKHNLVFQKKDICYYLEEEHTQAPSKAASKVAKPEEVNDIVERRSRKTKEQREEEKNSKSFPFFLFLKKNEKHNTKTMNYNFQFSQINEKNRTKGSRREEKRTSKTIGREKEARGIVEIQ